MNQVRENQPGETRTHPALGKTPQRVFVVINPAAGQDQPILKSLNKIFQENGVDWDIAITKDRGDGRRLARNAAQSGVDLVMVYGGDGTVMECASGLVGSQTPLAILPGGTANVMARELGLPLDLVAAATLAINPQSRIRCVDMGQVGEQTFLLRAGIGFEAEMVEGADRELKDRLGVLAYGLSALQTLADPPIARYWLCLDGAEEECDGVACVVANSGNMGAADIVLSKSTDISDGLLDVFVVTKADLPSLVSLVASVVSGRPDPPALKQWQVREVTIESEPNQPVQLDGELIGQTPVTVKILPEAVQIIIPPE
ncbi:MAG: diacylglycerol kinase family lipid kinase [Anaerolineales bacterium]|jgi:diacylglycerol kinase (ATP)